MQAAEGNFLLSGHFSANRNQHLEANCARHKFRTHSDLQGIAGAPWFGGGCFLGGAGELQGLKTLTRSRMCLKPGKVLM